MGKHTENNVKLGAFVLAGLIALLLTFYGIGKNKSIFNSNFKLKARFSNSNGLLQGNNVLYSGIQAGTVKTISIVNDTTIEVILLIDHKLKPFIHKNAMVSIGTEGLMGNKVVQILPGRGIALPIEDGDLLTTIRSKNMDEMLQTLSKTNENIEGISEALKQTVVEINQSAILEFIKDKQIVKSLRSTLENVNQTSVQAKELSQNLNRVVKDVKKGKGAAGLLLNDTSFASNLSKAVRKMSSASDHANNLTIQLEQMSKNMNRDLQHSNGFLDFLIKDSLLIKKLNSSMDHIEKGTDGFNQNMEALKHNFLFRGYFKKLEKQEKKRLPKP
jgi:phospholipid/cholesterol/gamma-HCH transport system substrate-binding protein